MTNNNHPDLKPSNILLELDDSEEVIASYLERTSLRIFRSNHTQLGDVGTGSEKTAMPTPLSEVITTPLLSETDKIRVRIIDFGVCRLLSLRIILSLDLPEVTNVPLAASWVHQHLTDQIQSPHLRAPEVMLGAPWSTGVDIWSLGCLVCRYFPKVVDST